MRISCMFRTGPKERSPALIEFPALFYGTGQDSVWTGTEIVPAENTFCHMAVGQKYVPKMELLNGNMD